MNKIAHKQTLEQTRSTVESRVKLECEKEHQEQLLLSVIPAYIAAEVKKKKSSDNLSVLKLCCV